MKGIEKHIGKFRISAEMIIQDYKLVQKVLSEVVVVKCESLFVSHELEYVALSEHFDKVEEGCMPPIYTISVSNGIVSFKK